MRVACACMFACEDVQINHVCVTPSIGKKISFTHCVGFSFHGHVWLASIPGILFINISYEASTIKESFLIRLQGGMAGGIFSNVLCYSRQMLTRPDVPLLASGTPHHNSFCQMHLVKSLLQSYNFECQSLEMLKTGPARSRRDVFAVDTGAKLAPLIHGIWRHLTWPSH